MKIEWDPRKAKSNLKKHGVSFEEAATALSDSMAATGTDPDHSIDEQRHISFGVRSTSCSVSHRRRRGNSNNKCPQSEQRRARIV